MNRFYKKLILATFIFIGLITVSLGSVLHAAPLVPCGNGTGECTICDLQVLAMNVLNFFVLISTVVAALLFFNAGFLYVTSPSNTGNISKAHSIFTSTLVGIIIILAAWLIINTIMVGLLNPSGPLGTWNNVLCIAPTGSNALVGPPPPPLNVVAAGPGYVAGDFETNPAYPTGKVLSSAALSAGLANATSNCNAGAQTCTDYIIAQATALGVDPNYALALAAVESGGCTNPATCQSAVGAVGVIQLMPATARDLCGSTCAGMTDSEMRTLLQDPSTNITLGVKYMAQSSAYVDAQMAADPDRFSHGTKADYMAAYYNGGPTALQPSNDCGGTYTKFECTINPGGYVETQEYVEKMNTYVNSVSRGTEIVGG